MIGGTALRMQSMIGGTALHMRTMIDAALLKNTNARKSKHFSSGNSDIQERMAGVKGEKG
eukprot:85846-Chlamydomonas_euryale.AAC.1